MRRLAILILSCAACQEPPRTAQMVTSVRGLVDLHTWDPSTEGRGQYGYDAVMSAGAEILPSLVAHLTDETPTMLYDRTFDIHVTLGDVCYYLLLKITGRPAEEFREDGVFILSSLPNPIFCIRWKAPSLECRRRVQMHFLKILPPPEE